MTEYRTVGFIGLGVMGEPICRNLVKKSGRRVLAFDRGELAKWIEDPHACALLMTKIASLLSGRLRDAQVQLLSFSATPTHA